MHWQPPRMYRNLDDPITGFQVLGERNSGTNFVTQLLLRNLVDVERVSAYGWKHGFIDRRAAATDGLLTVMVYRHPIRWIRSLHARPLALSRRMSGLSFSEFIRHDWLGAFAKDDDEEPSTADREPKTGRVFSNPLALRSAKVAYFEEMAAMPASIAYLRFEDANRDPRAVLAALAEGFGLRRGPFTPVETFKGLGPRRYIPRQLPPVGAADMAFIRKELDLAQEARIGYRLEDLPRFDGLASWDPRSLRSMARAALVRTRSGGRFRRAKG